MASPESDYCSPPAEKKMPTLVDQRVLTTEELIYLFADGKGRAYPFSTSSSAEQPRADGIQDERSVVDDPPPGELLQ